MNDKMIKTLIIDDDLIFSKNILNFIISKLKNVQLSYIATTYKESIDILLNNQIDLIFLDLNLPDENALTILDDLKYMNNIKNPHIIIISGDAELSKQVYENAYIHTIINKLEPYEDIFRKVKEIIYSIDYTNNYKQIEQFVTTEIINLGYNIKYKGTIYIIESIIYIYSKNNFDFVDNLEQNVYKYISYIHNKSINNIKTNIIKATNEREKEKMKLYKLTPKTSIITVLNKIRNQYL